MIARDGTLVESLRKGIAAPTDEELAGWAQLPAGADELAEQGARAKDDRAAEDFYLRTFAEPALDVNGIATGSPHLQKTVLPVEAVANVSIRLAPGQTSRRSRPRSSALLRAAAPDGAELEVELWSSAPPGLVPPDAKAVQLGLDAFERALGRRPALIRTGGTLPIVPALADKGIPTVITGFGLPDSQIHSPNERLVAEYVPLGHRRRARAPARVQGSVAAATGRARPQRRPASGASSASAGRPARGRRRDSPGSPRPARACRREGRGCGR